MKKIKNIESLRKFEMDNNVQILRIEGGQVCTANYTGTTYWSNTGNCSGCDSGSTTDFSHYTGDGGKGGNCSIDFGGDGRELDRGYIENMFPEVRFDMIYSGDRSYTLEQGFEFSVS